MKNNLTTLKYNINNTILRQVHSFVFRKRKLKLSQKIFFEKYWPKFGIDFVNSNINFNDIFKNNNPIILEIGFGTGESLINIAMKNLCNNFLGIEVYTPGVLSCLQYIKNYNLKNIRIIFHDAVEVISYMLSENSLFEVYVFFPDPWPKKRHQKRRMINKQFLELILKKLKLGGFLYITTDCQTYVHEIINQIKKIKGYEALLDKSFYISRPNFRSLTKFEKRGITLGNKIFDLKFKSLLK